LNTRSKIPEKKELRDKKEKITLITALGLQKNKNEKIKKGGE